MAHQTNHAELSAQAVMAARRARARAVAVAVDRDQQAERSQLLRRLALATGLGALAALGAALLAPSQAQALTMQECSAKYKAAQAAGTLGAMKWNDFRKSQCGDATAATAPPAGQGAAPAAQAAPSPRPSSQQPASAAAGSAVFPRAIAAKYAKEKPAKQRMYTCLDQYNANKASGGAGNGGLNWIEKGGGYYSECNRRLKG